MKLENMCDVIKTNLSEGCGGPTYVANCIRKNETSLNIYCESESYDEFEQRILKEGPTNVVYCIVSRCGKDRENHYERIKCPLIFIHTIVVVLKIQSLVYRWMENILHVPMMGLLLL